MSQINYPCRWCGGELVIINSVVTCVKCHPPRLSIMADLQKEVTADLDNEMLNQLKKHIDNDIVYGRKPIRLKSDMYSKSKVANK